MKREQKEKILKPHTDKQSGHLSVTLIKEGVESVVPVYRLVLESFVGPCPEGYAVHHLDGDTTNNSLENLSWVPKDSNNVD